MANYEVGDRVGAIFGVDSDTSTVTFLGYGVFSGWEVPVTGVGYLAEVLKEINVENPKITLDNGDVVWGCECWFGKEEVVKRKVVKWQALGYHVVTERIDDIRADYNAEEAALVGAVEAVLEQG